ELALEVEVLAGGEALAVEALERGGELLGALHLREGGLEAPIARGAEAHPGALALHDDPRRDALDPARRKPRHDLLPEDRRDLVAVEAIEDPARLLGVDQPPIDLARLL